MMRTIDELRYGNVSPFEQCTRGDKRLKELLKLVAGNREELDGTEPLITHTYPLSKIDEAYELFENKRDGVIKVAVEC